MGLTFRMAAPEDWPGLNRLWVENTDWGDLNPRLRSHFMEECPWGPARTVVAVDDDGEIVGEFVFLPHEIWAGGRQLRAYRAGAPIVSKKIRLITADPREHPISRMFNHGVDVLRASGEQLVFMIPDPRWVRFLSLSGRLRSGSFPLWSLPLPLAETFVLPDGYTTARLTQYDERVDRLWHAARAQHGCIIARDARSLLWKVAKPGYPVLGVEYKDELVGLVASGPRGDRQWTICDVLSVDTGAALRATLMAVCNFGHELALKRPPDKPYNKLAVLATPVIQPAVEELGFKRDDYDFPISVRRLDKNIPWDEVAPEQWYVSVND